MKGCKICGKKKMKSYYPLCLSCWIKEQKKLETPTEIQQIKTKEEFVKEGMSKTNWDKMGHLEGSGRYTHYVDTSPGAGYKEGSIYFIYFAIVAFLGFASLPLALIFLILGITYFIFSSIAKGRYLEKRYDEEVESKKRLEDLKNKLKK